MTSATRPYRFGLLALAAGLWLLLAGAAGAQQGGIVRSTADYVYGQT